MPEPPPVTTAILPEKSFIGFPPLCPPPPIRLAGRSFSYTAQHSDRHVPPSRPANSYCTETFASIQSEIVPFRYTPSKRSIFWIPVGEMTFCAPIFRCALTRRAVLPALGDARPLLAAAVPGPSAARPCKMPG